jgi:hypothetical protein
MGVFQPVIQSFDGQTLIGKKGIVKKIFYPPAPGDSSRVEAKVMGDLC